MKCLKSLFPEARITPILGSDAEGHHMPAQVIIARLCYELLFENDNTESPPPLPSNLSDDLLLALRTIGLDKHRYQAYSNTALDHDDWVLFGVA